MIHEYFLPVLFFIVFLIIFVYVLILTIPSIRKHIQEISALISIPLSLLAIVSSGSAIYYIYDELRYPELEFDISFKKEEKPEISKIVELGGIYLFRFKNVGNEDAVSIEISGGIYNSESQTKIEKFGHKLIGIGKRTTSSPYILKTLEPNKMYYGIIAVSCANCREMKQWYLEINTKKQHVNAIRVALNIGVKSAFKDWFERH